MIRRHEYDIQKKIIIKSFELYGVLNRKHLGNEIFFVSFFFFFHIPRFLSLYNPYHLTSSYVGIDTHLYDFRMKGIQFCTLS